MAKIRSWTDKRLVEAVASSRSYRMVLIKLELIPAGGNYEQIKRRIKELNVSTGHFTSMGWSVGIKKPYAPVDYLLVENGTAQS
jgi:hypothetical protein